MLKRPGRILIIAGVVLFTLLILARAAAVFYTEYLWFASEGFASVLWTRIQAEVVVRLATGAVAAGIVLLNLWLGMRHLGPIHVRRRYGNIEIAEQIPRSYIFGGVVLTAIFAGWWLSALGFGGGTALGVIAWLRHVPWGVTDPQFGRDVGFYVFALPVYFQLVDFLILVVVWSAALVLLSYVVVGGVRWRENRVEVDDNARLHFVILLSGAVLLLAARYWFGRYGLLLEGTGVRGALGYTDVHARLPAHRAMTTLSVLAAAALLYGASRRSWLPPLVAMGALLMAAIGVAHIYPSTVQRFRVEPNQLALEEPFIRWNIDFTRQAYGLEEIQRSQLPFRQASVPDWDELAPALSRLPLWDIDPLATIFREREARQPYYHFPTVDFNRYGPAGTEQQVALAIREVNTAGIAADARTWQTQKLNPLYIRGHGAVITPAAQHNQREPVLWVSNMPVVHHTEAFPELRLTEPGIYFGQSTTDYVILVPERDSAFLASPGRDSPAGITLNSFPRLLALAWRFTDLNLLFSRDITRESRLVYRRAVTERVRTIAPFLLWELEQAYPVVHNGRVVWVVEGFTASQNFPLSRAVSPARLRYLRNSVKATVDAISGEVTLYALDDQDPILATYSRVFSDLFQPLSAMPPELRRHLRYPASYLTIQAELLKEYYLDRPAAFYAGQDFWQVPPEPGLVERPFRAGYAMMKLPGETQPEFLLTLPFTPRERQNLTALLVARNDPPNYGQLVLLELPADQQIRGPTQVDALMEQDALVAQQFGFWQRTNDVERGRLRIVPLDSGLLYVRPIFLKSQSRPIPDLVGVVASDGVRVRMTHTPASLAGAIAALRSPDADVTDLPPELRDLERLAELTGMDNWTRRALELLEDAESRLRNLDYAGFGARMAELRELLNRINREPPM